MPKKGDEFLQLVPELSAVGESPSNGKAERTVQTVEDMVRTYLSALEGRLQGRVNSDSPVPKYADWIAMGYLGLLDRPLSKLKIRVLLMQFLHFTTSRTKSLMSLFAFKIFYYFCDFEIFTVNGSLNTVWSF